jgi:hypothetical protein
MNVPWYATQPPFSKHVAAVIATKPKQEAILYIKQLQRPRIHIKLEDMMTRTEFLDILFVFSL